MDTRAVTMVALSTATTPARSRSATMTTRRRSSRSASAPAHSPNSSQGSRCSTAAIATRTALRVCEATSSGPAARAIPSPMLLTHQDASSHRKPRPSRGGVTTSTIRLTVITTDQPTEGRRRRRGQFGSSRPDGSGRRADFLILALSTYDGRRSTCARTRRPISRVFRPLTRLADETGAHLGQSGEYAGGVRCRRQAGGRTYAAHRRN